MIKLIVTSGGYVESNWVAKIFWRYQGQGKKLKPLQAFQSLIDELLYALQN